MILVASRSSVHGIVLANRRFWAGIQLAGVPRDRSAGPPDEKKKIGNYVNKFCCERGVDDFQHPSGPDPSKGIRFPSFLESERHLSPDVHFLLAHIPRLHRLTHTRFADSD